MKNNKTKKQIIEDFKDRIDKHRCFPTCKTMWLGKKSENSFALVIKGEPQPSDKLKDDTGKDYPTKKKNEIRNECKNYVKRTLKQCFHINPNDPEFNAILNGEGSEWRKMRTINSSSLCGYLHFHNVSEKTPFYLDGKSYTKAYFEFENPCVNNPSSVDVVLTNEKKDKSILFLELKFTEYLSGGSVELSSDYIKPEYYPTIFEKRINIPKKGDEQKLFGLIHIKNIGKKGYLQLKSVAERGEKPYVGGLKQVISHCIGINKFISKNGDKRKWVEFGKLHRQIGFKPDPKRIRYAEMSFVLPGAENAFERFSNSYSDLIEILKEKYPNINFVGNKPYTYNNEFINNPENKRLLAEEVIKFYYR